MEGWGGTVKSIWSSLAKLSLPLIRTKIQTVLECIHAPGYDQFMNIVLVNTVEIVSPTEKNEIGMVVIRGPSTETVSGRGMDFGPNDPKDANSFLLLY